MSLSKLFRTNLAFFIPYLLVLIVGLMLNLSYTQDKLFFFINHPLLASVEDPLMEYYTNVGDGVFCIIVVLLLAVFRVRFGLISALAFLLQAGIVQFLKRVIFVDHIRPWAMLKDTGRVHLVKDFTPYTSNSFPSGHTATAFAMFSLLSFFSKDKRLGIIFFLLALMVGYSRIYLAQHFFLDTYVGSVVGVLSAILIYSYFYRSESWINRKSWLDKPLYKLRS